jgi:hypothetical protein
VKSCDLQLTPFIVTDEQQSYNSFVLLAVQCFLLAHLSVMNSDRIRIV